MKKFALALIVTLFGFNLILPAQDVIYRKDGSKEEAKIVLVSEKEIQYKKFSNPDGPVYAVPKSEIILITYENGEYELLRSTIGPTSDLKKELEENFTRNLITYHLFDVIYGDFTISYERILSSGTVGIKIPVGFGYAFNSDYFGNGDWIKNLIYSGIGVNLYPTGQGKWRYFVGPELRIGYGKQSSWMFYYDEYGNYYEEEEDSEGLYTKFIVDNGIIFTPVRNFSLTAMVGVGIRYFPQADFSYNTVMPTGFFSFNVNYRF